MANLIAVDTWPNRKFEGHCPRCGSARQHENPDGSPGEVDNTAGYLCRDCIAQSWEKAESYGGTYEEVQIRAWNYQKEWRALDLNRLKSTLTER